MSSVPSICFIEGSAYAVLDPSVQRASTGGEAVQHTLLARAFAARGWQVSLISRDIGQPDGIVIDGVKVWKTHTRWGGLPYVKFFYPRMFKNWRALRKANADIYFHSCAGFMTGMLARFVARHDRKMIFRIAHDSDCIPGQQLIKLERDRRAYEYGLRNANLISAQSKTQAELLQKHYDLSSHVIDMAAEIPAEPDDADRDIDVLWVNNFREFKRPELVLDIARQMPDVSFTMIGGRMKGEDALYDDVEREASGIDNLHFVGGVPYSEVNDYFARARFFLNTSDSEGFPNSFLQAWVRRVPVISYFDPDGLIGKNRIGVSVESQQDFASALSSLVADDSTRLDMGERARRFVIDRYSPDAIAAAYEQRIADTLGIPAPDG